ncbi:MAG: aminopeptidase P family N-terminal domain-containing protein, partial [Oscillospiraceae bacterium]
MSVSERLSALRAEMKRNGIDMYYIPTDDYHGSEYVCGHFKCREYISGFTGSAGTVIVTDSYAGLWTDGRYFIQAEKQLRGTEYVLNRSGETGVLPPTEYILKNLGNGVLGFDGRTVSASFAEKIISEVGRKHVLSVDLMDRIWKDRPELPCEKGFYLDEKYSGKSCTDKLAEIRRLIAKAHGDYFLLSSPDDICWLLNVRGNDIPYNPVILSYAAVSEDSLVWFVDENKLTPELTARLHDVKIRPYDDFYDFIGNIPSGKSVIIDKSRLNFEAVNRLSDGVKLIERQNLTLLPKARKNETEIKNERAAHIKDGAAVTKFIYEIKNHPEKYTELSAARLMIALRSKQEGYIEE